MTTHVAVTLCGQSEGRQHTHCVINDLHNNKNHSVATVLVCVVLFQITKPGKKTPSKNSVGILDHENTFTQKLKTRKFSDLR